MRSSSATFAPASASRSTAMICSSENRFFIVRFPFEADSNPGSDYVRGARQDDVDFAAGTVRIQRARTFRGTVKGRKISETRDVDLVPLALEALEAMKPLTRLERAEIFESPWTGKPFHEERSQRDHAWKPTLAALGIRSGGRTRRGTRSQRAP